MNAGGCKLTTTFAFGWNSRTIKLTLSFALATLSCPRYSEVLMYVLTCVKVPHVRVSPDLAAYKSLHVETLSSDAWWIKTNGP
ncbi:hypothetical protein P692DRAFT_201604809 [Suillus brevipes Sb2]|nr:hypothetical protein P692DRAFT_201604809 [Suillus brevipes Sb2]